MKLCIFLFCLVFLTGFTHLPVGIRISCSHPGLIALTFDDGVTKNSIPLLNILDLEQVKASFFIVGETLVERHGLSTLRQISTQGHFIANHTWTHLYLTHLQDQQIETEVLTTQNGIDTLTTPKPRYLRPPYGAINQHVYDKLTEMGFKVVLWNFDSRDWDVRKTKTTIWAHYQHTMATADPKKDSFIILLHERRITLALLSDMIRTGREKGFEFVTIDKCIP